MEETCKAHRNVAVRERIEWLHHNSLHKWSLHVGTSVSASREHVLADCYGT